jgi:hypothetical protein
MPPLLVPAVTPSHGGMSAYGTKPTCLYVRYLVAMGWKADFEQAASVIVLCARQGASLRQRGSGAGAIRSLFQLMGRSTGYWYRRGRGVPVGEGRVALVTAASIAIHRILNAPISTRCVIAANEGAMRLKSRARACCRASSVDRADPLVYE